MNIFKAIFFVIFWPLLVAKVLFGLSDIIDDQRAQKRN